MNIKGVVLAGGTGSRLFPLTKITSKHLLPIGYKPMIQHSIEQLVNAGIVEIAIETGGEHVGQYAEYLGSGAEFGCKLTYKVQDQAGGIAEALGLVESMIDKRNDDRLCVVLGDNIFEDEFKNFVADYRKYDKLGYPAMVALKEVDDPVGQLNDDWLQVMASFSEKIICAWGCNDLALGKLWFYEGELYCLGMTKHGNPKHPLYLKKDLVPIIYTGGR